MKRTERHHLKENAVAEWVLGLKEWFEANRTAATYGALAIAVVAVGVLGTTAWRQSSSNKASAMLADAMVIADAPVAVPAAAEPGQTPVQQPGTYPSAQARFAAALPKFMATAEAYPVSEAGLIARYRAAAALVGLGRTDEAVQRYQEVVDRSTGVYQAMARLGIADASLVAGQYDKAIAAFEDVIAKHPEDAPIDGVLAELGRAYRLAGKAEDARKAYKRIVDEFPQSPYAAQARRELES